MVYTWQEIEQNWLPGGGLTASPDEVVSAFNEVAARFGREWVEASRKGTRGAAVALTIMTMARFLRSLTGASNTTGLLEKVRRGDSDCRAELVAIDLIRTGNPGAIVEVEPEIQVSGHNRKPDFRTRMPREPWTYVEVTNPNTTDSQKEVQRAIERLTGLLNDCSGNFGLEVFFRREPSSAELDMVTGLIMQEHRRGAQATVELPSDLGTLYWNHQPPGVVVLDDHGEPYTPRLGGTAVAVHTDQAGQIDEHRHMAVRWPFTDLRAANFLWHEAKQLPKDAPGLVMIYTTSSVVGAMKAWRALIEPRFRPGMHTRVSAVCLFSSGVRASDHSDAWYWDVRTKLILNPHARFPLPQSIVEQLERFPSEERDI
jgi:hypothetical protein